MKLCSIEGCLKKHVAKGLCRIHYTCPTPCSIEECPRFVHAKGLCNQHYRSLRRHGDPHKADRKHKGINLVKRKATKKAWYQAHKNITSDYDRSRRLKRNFGLTLEEYNNLFNLQKGLCAICFRPEPTINPSGEVKKLAIDHDHKTNVIRELLCSFCNPAIGLMGESPDRLRSAANYLEKHNANQIPFNVDLSDHDHSHDKGK